MPAQRIHNLNLKQIAHYSLTGIVLGLIYIVLVNGFSHFYPYINGTLIGLLLGLLIGTLEVYVFAQRLQQYPFITMLTIRVVIYMISIVTIILIVVTENRAVRNDQNFLEALQSEESQAYIFRGNFKVAIAFTFIAAVLANFIRLVSFKIGRGMPTNFFLGIYYRPRLVERLFVFIQVSNAKEVLTHHALETYHQFINEIYREISIAAIHHSAYVYEYVDDQMIIYWKAGNKNWTTALPSFCKEISSVMSRNRDHFEKTYHIIPKLLCAVHGGSVIQAEIGELKTEIVFHGDVLNTTARIVNVALAKNERFVTSHYIADQIAQSAISSLHPIGEIALRGKQMPLSLYALHP